MLGMAAMALACLVLIALFYRDPPQLQQSQPARLILNLTRP
jgi:hypothetical protein